MCPLPSSRSAERAAQSADLSHLHRYFYLYSLKRGILRPTSLHERHAIGSSWTTQLGEAFPKTDLQPRLSASTLSAKMDEMLGPSLTLSVSACEPKEREK